MPLLTSPIGGAPMRQIFRHGIEFDVCPTTGGVWLDKGELEKLIALVKDETLQGSSRQRGRTRDDDEDDGDDGDDRGRNRASGGRRSRLSDLFDF
jgi:Zn-finger nucleic acid-binding protein